MVLVYLQNAIRVSFRSSSYHGTSIGSTNCEPQTKLLTHLTIISNLRWSEDAKNCLWKYYFLFEAAQKYATKMSRELIGLWNFSVVSLLKRAVLWNLDIILQITEHSDTRELLIISTLLQDNAIQETLADWRQLIFLTPDTIWMVNVRCTQTRAYQNCLVVLFSNLRIYL